MRPIIPTIPNVMGTAPNITYIPSQPTLNTGAYRPYCPPLVTSALRPQRPYTAENAGQGYYNAAVPSTGFYSNRTLHLAPTSAVNSTQAYRTSSVYNMPLMSQIYTTYPSSQGIADQKTTSALPAAQRGPTVYLGHLTQNIDDMVIRQLLQECGRVVRWSRTTDPATKKLSTFGFCEFESPLGVMRAVRCLNGLVLDGQELVANCEDKVKDGLENWRRDRKNKLQEENPSKSIQEIEADIEREELRILNVTQKIASDWNARVSEPIAKPSSESTIIELVEPVIEEKSMTKATTEKQSCVPNLKENIRRDWLDSMPGYVDISSSTPVSSRAAARIRTWNNKLKEGRIDFRKRMQAWVRKEASMLKERERRREETKKFLKDPTVVSKTQIKKLIELDRKNCFYALWNDGGCWEGLISSRKIHERILRVEKERLYDEEDRLNEKEEELKQMRELEEIIEKNESLETSDEAQEDQSIIKSSTLLGSGTEQPVIPPNGDNLDISGDSESYKQDDNTTETTPIKISLGFTGSKKSECFVKTELQKNTSSLFSALYEEEDDELHGQKHAPLVRLDAPLHRENQRNVENITSSLSQELLIQLASEVPKETSELFTYPLKWQLLNTYRVLELKVTPWITKKVVEFLGEEEPELVSFIADALKDFDSINPADLILQLKDFLDEQAEGFIVKLWKLLVFEELRLQHQMNKLQKEAESENILSCNNSQLKVS